MTNAPALSLTWSFTWLCPLVDSYYTYLEGLSILYSIFTSLFTSLTVKIGEI